MRFGFCVLFLAPLFEGLSVNAFINHYPSQNVAHPIRPPSIRPLPGKALSVKPPSIQSIKEHQSRLPPQSEKGELAKQHSGKTDHGEDDKNPAHRPAEPEKAPRRKVIAANAKKYGRTRLRHSLA